MRKLLIVLAVYASFFGGAKCGHGAAMNRMERRVQGIYDDNRCIEGPLPGTEKFFAGDPTMREL